MVKKRKTKEETQKIKEKDQFYGKQNKKKKAKIDSKKANKEKMTGKRILKIKQRKQKKSGDKVKICPKNGVPAICLFNAQKVLNYERLQVVQWIFFGLLLKHSCDINQNFFDLHEELRIICYYGI